jgi:Glycosyl transferases group 1
VKPLEILLLTDFDRRSASTIRDHVRSFGAFSRHRFRRLSIYGDLPPRLDLSRFDGIVIHYTLIACMDNYLSRATRARLRAFAGLKAMFIQDEYRFVNRTIAAMRDLGINLLFTCVPLSEMEKVYPAEALPGMAKVNVLTGYVPPNLLERAVPSLAARPIDIGYRSRRVPDYLGRLGREKWEIGERVAADAAKYGLVTDISCREEDRIYGEVWIDFVSSCKAMLGVESGASVFDFTGDIERCVAEHIRCQPDVRYEELEQLYLAEHEGKISLNQISPRCFEAAALRTLMILYEGEYSGILTPWRHYVPLRKDHANMAEVVEVLRDPARMAAITDRAYREVALDPRYSFAGGVALVDDAIDATVRPEMMSRKRPYATVGFHWVAFVSARILLRRLRNLVLEIARGPLLGLAQRCLPAERVEQFRGRLRRWRGIEAR